MDLDEWEFIPDDGFLEIHDDGGNKIYSRKYVENPSNTVFNMNYFISPSSRKSEKFVESTDQVSRLPKQLVPQLQPNILKAPDLEVVKKIMIELPQKIKSPNIGVPDGADQESVSQIFFKKMEENKFVDMKMDSPKSGNRGILPQIEARKIQFEEKDDQKTMETAKSEKEEDENEMIAWDENNGDEEGANMWKWSLTGIGAICSFGVAAAATICIIILGSGPKRNQQHHHQKLRFQIYVDDKRMKEVNEALSAARGIPLSRAHITYGGYYDGL